MTPAPDSSGMTRHNLIAAETADRVISAFFEVYNTLGPGFLERVFSDALEIELVERGCRVQREVAIPIWYKGRRISPQRVDIIVDEKVLLEIKSTSAVHPDAERQLLDYLRASAMQVGLLLHFGPKPRFLRRVHTEKNHEPGPATIRAVPQ